jgi:hypothetical protein
MRAFEWVLCFETPVTRPDDTNHEIEIINTTTSRCDFDVNVRRGQVTVISFLNVWQGTMQWLTIKVANLIIIIIIIIVR